ncbi:lish domain-containing [Plakobranchus ocellatus]|uniref:Lish domain-containing n=1 Tax=Plakobranchus ocellatus TaxID=259542 RepID=A0AAV3YQF3_9GAST|nr:lish domain-containing [Plakobranchus ocellatus]
MGIQEDHIHHENQDDASIEGQAEQENLDLLPRPKQGRELQEEDEAETENREDDIRVDANDEDLQKRGRKRTRNPGEWKRNIQKRLKYTGKAYASTTGKEKTAKTIGPSCGVSCALKCSSHFDDKARETIFKGY